MKYSLSVIIIHYKRIDNLTKTLDGLTRQTVRPTEVIIVEMGARTPLNGKYPFDVVTVMYGEKWEFLPLAAARNIGANAGLSDTLLFLDVDCVPDVDYCERMARAVNETDGLVMASPRYLLKELNNEDVLNDLYDKSVPHPIRPSVIGIVEEPCYEMFWSLCFGISKQRFAEIGGFTEAYEGYGGEDTDFAMKAKIKKVPFYLCEALAFHQQHPVYIPPLNHFESIVRNCNRFYAAWGQWIMEDCLEDFSAMGYITWSKARKSDIELLAIPTTKTIREHLVENAPYR